MATNSARDRKSTRLNSSHQIISYAVFCLKTKKHTSNSSHQIISYAVFCFKKKEQNAASTATVQVGRARLVRTGEAAVRSANKCLGIYSHSPQHRSVGTSCNLLCLLFDFN